MLNTVCHFEIPADNLESLKEFYSGMFGWTFEKMPGPVEYHVIKTGSEELMGGMMQRQDPSHIPMNYIMVESVDDSVKKAQDMGASICVPKTPVPGMGWFAVLVDPQKNPFGLWQADTAAG